MADTDKKLRDVLRAIETVRKSLQSTQAHAAGADYVWVQIGRAADELKRVEGQVEEAIRDVRDRE